MGDDEAVGRYPPAHMDPTQYEREVTRLFERWARSEGLTELQVTHGESVKGSDGTYKIDTVVRWEAMGLRLVMLVEAKLHGRAVERKVITDLVHKVRVTASHKGAVVSTAGFQQGAVRVATANGVALVQFVDGVATIEYKSMMTASPDRQRPATDGTFAAFHVYGTEHGVGFSRLDNDPERLAGLS